MSKELATLTKAMAAGLIAVTGSAGLGEPTGTKARALLRKRERPVKTRRALTFTPDRALPKSNSKPPCLAHV